MNELPAEVGIISQDSYYKENKNLSFDERALINFDHPRDRFRIVSCPFKRAKSRKNSPATGLFFCNS
jgi:uridine kinase